MRPDRWCQWEHVDLIDQRKILLSFDDFPVLKENQLLTL